MRIPKVFEKDPFFCRGRVHPAEYDWKQQFHDLAILAYVKDEPFLSIDVTKVLGLARYTADLEKQLKIQGE